MKKIKKPGFPRFAIVKFDDKTSRAGRRVRELRKKLTNMYAEIDKANDELYNKQVAWCREQNAKVREQLKAAPKYQIYPVYRPQVSPDYRLKGVQHYVTGVYSYAVRQRNALLAKSPGGCDAFKNELKQLLRKYDKD